MQSKDTGHPHGQTRPAGRARGAEKSITPYHGPVFLVLLLLVFTRNGINRQISKKLAPVTETASFHLFVAVPGGVSFLLNFL